MVNLTARDKQYGHRCYHAECPSCREYKDLRHHQCFLQNYEQEQDRRHRKAQARENANAAKNDRPARVLPPPPTKDDDEEDTDLYVYFDIESMQVPDPDHAHLKRHQPNLVIAERDDSDTP